MHASANIAVEGVIVAVIVIALFIFYRLLMYTNTRSIEAEKRLCS